MRSGTEAATVGSDALGSPGASLGAWAAVLRPIAHVAASSALLGIAVPPHEVAPAAWVALVPLVLALRPGSTARAALVGFAFGLASLAAMHAWFLTLAGANLFNVGALFGYLSLYPAIWCAVLAWLMRRGLPWVFPGAVLWVLLDWIRAHAGPFALPWDPLAHSQIADIPLLQLAAVGGAPLITLVVCLCNLAVARAWRSGRPGVLIRIAGAVGAAHACGYLLVPPAHQPSGPRIAIVQPADDAARPAAKLARLRRLTLLATGQRPDLIVWPESAVDGYAFDRKLQDAVMDIARDAKAPILFGSADFGKYAKSAGNAAERVQFKNQAYLVFPDGAREGPYTKNRLVPFGEYMPFEGRVDWPRWLVRRQIHGIAGREPGLFRLAGGTTLGVLICWENYFTGLADRLVRRGAGIVVQLSNDADFGASAEPAQHNAASVLRAVEYRRPWLQVSAQGPSMLVDASGAVSDTLGPVGASGWIVRTVSPAATTTVYERFGLAWFWLVAAFAALLVAQRFIRREGSHVHIETN